ncbi:MAG: hypothetical protein Q7T20_17215 [Saprospiraceae bacterium]|nr:hypothetical protein [Saprospiraceae bacterium]
MKNKSLGIIAAILLSAGLAFAFVNTNSQACCAPENCNKAAQTCCDMPCPIPCCEE